MTKKPHDADVSAERDEVMRRLIATPPKAQRDEPKRRASPEPIGRLIKEADEKRKRDKA